jgi:hypothetical protein
MYHKKLSPRAALAGIAAATGSSGFIAALAQSGDNPFAVATFAADVTPPLGHPLLAN